MYKRLHKFSEQQRNFYNLQYGLRLNISKTNALTSIIEYIQINVDKGECAGGAFIDLNKAFDIVDHEKNLSIKE